MKKKASDLWDSDDSDYDKLPEFVHNDIKDYEFLNEISREANYKIFRVKKKTTSEIFSAKILTTTDVSIAMTFFKEIDYMNSINSRFTLKYRDMSYGDETHAPSYIFDYYDNGTLSNLMIKGDEITDLQKLKIIYGIASGMSDIHSKNIIHCDLKPDNIYIDNYLLPIISNFDVALTSDELNSSSISTRGTITFMAPEVMLEQNYDQKADIYSFSIILYFICQNGSLPKISILDKTNGKLPPIPNSIPRHYADLIRDCMSFDPAKRPSFQQIVELLSKFDQFLTSEEDKQEFSNFLDGLGVGFKKIHIDYGDLQKLEVDFDPIDLTLFENENAFIGSGVFGNVYKVKEKSTGKIYAAKTNKNTLNQCNPLHVYSLSREINILSKLKNPSIMKFIGYSENNFEGLNKPTVITEFIKNNSLGGMINLQARGLTPDEWTSTKMLIAAYGIASGMAHVHSLNFIHRDLKPDNVFLDEYLHPKIGDFGTSKAIDDDSPLENLKPIGTPLFMSPEIFNTNEYSKAGDVYAYAILLYQMLTLETTINGINGLIKLMNFVLAGNRPEFKFPIHECYKKLIEKCWKNDPNERPTFDEIVRILEGKEFITDDVDEDEYLDYISFIKKQKLKKPFIKAKFDFDKVIKSIIDEFSNKPICLNLKYYTKEKFIRREGIYKVYEIKRDGTDELFEAKISNIPFLSFPTNDMIHLEREINILNKIDHILFLKFVGLSFCDFKGRPMPVIVTETPPNNSLFNLLQMERSNKHNDEWDDTQKLITIYGIVSGMAYLHSHKIIHRNLSPESIFFDEYLHPKIGNFGLLTQIHSKYSLTHQTSLGLKSNTAYASPELLESYEYSKSSDVYAFALITYEILTNNVAFENVKTNQIFKEVVTKNNRPKIGDDVGESFRELIEACWSQNPDDRPSFEMIEEFLIENAESMTKNVDKKRFLRYVNFLKNAETKFHANEKILNLDELISKKKSVEDEKEDENNKNKSHSTKNINKSYVKGLPKIKSKDKDDDSKSKIKTKGKDDDSKSKIKAKDKIDDSKSKNKSKDDDSKAKIKAKDKVDDSKSKRKTNDDDKTSSKIPSKSKSKGEDENKAKNKKSLAKINETLSSISNKEYIGPIDLDLVNYLFDESESIGSSLTTSNFKVKISQTKNAADKDFISFNLLKKKIYLKDGEIDKPKIDKFSKEIKIISDLNHPNIVKNLGFYGGDKNQAPTFLYEFYSKRLPDVIKKLDEAYLVSIIYEIGHAMKIVHSKKIIHRNLNVKNIFIDCENHAKIGDFGIPSLISPNDQINCMQHEPFLCFSREILHNEKYDEKTDVFAFGMIVQYILRRGRKPFLSKNDIDKGKKAKIPLSLNKLAFSIVSQCLSHSQNERPSFNAIINTIKRYDFKLIDGIDDKIEIIKKQLKQIIGNKAH